MGPQVIYSPGVAATGSGVVYPGDGSPVTNLYFAAPWLTPTVGRVANPPHSGSAQPIRSHVEQVGNLPYGKLPAWAFAGQAGEAFYVAGLARHPGGPLFAATTTSEVNEANTGTVFRSDDGGENWEPVPPLPLAWWLDSILITHEGTLLVGGMMYNPEEPETVPQGIIYRSTDMGEHWSVVTETADTGIVHTLLQRANGEVVAGTGQGGITLVSFDDGEHWELLPTPPNAGHVYALLETSESALYAGGERTGGSGVVYRFTGEAWEETGALDNAASVYALLEGPGHVIYAGTAFADETGQVFRSFNGGESWEPSGPLGESQAVRALLEGAEGRIYAGLEGPPGWFTTDAYVSEDVGETWQDAGYLFMAGAVHDFLPMPDGAVYAASGDTYGVIFRAEGLGAGGYQVYLPLVLRNF